MWCSGVVRLARISSGGGGREGVGVPGGMTRCLFARNEKGDG